MKSKIITKSLSVLSMCLPIAFVSCQNYPNSFDGQRENKVKTCCPKEIKPEKTPIIFGEDSIKLLVSVSEKEKKDDDSIQNDSKNEYHDYKYEEYDTKNNKDKVTY